MIGRVSEEPRRAIVVAVLALLVVAGFALRVRHLGDLGLVVDEGTQALAVRGALEHGRPLLHSGEIYTRNLGHLALQVLSAKLFGLDEFSLRLPGAVFGTLAVLATYFLGAATLSRRHGLLAAALIAFSTWEIELARYGRFYAVFQCLYIVSLLCFYRGFMLGRRRWALLFVVAAAATLTTHELAITLAGCFLIPVVSTEFSRGRKLASLGAALVFGALWSVYRKAAWALNPPPVFGDPAPVGTPHPPAVAPTPFRRLQEIVPIPGLQPPEGRALLQLWSDRPWLLVVPLGLALWAATRLLLRRGEPLSRTRIALELAILAAAGVHQFGLVVVLAAVEALLCLDPPFRDWVRPSRVVWGTVGALLLFWAAASALGPEFTVKAAVLDLFGYPDFLRYFLYWYVLGWPVLTVVVAAGTVLLLVRHASDRRRPAPLFLLGALGIPVVATSFFRAFQEARYTFHLYPLMVLVFAGSCLWLWSRLRLRMPAGHAVVRGGAAVACTLAVLWASQDADPLRAWSIGSRTYRSPRDPVRSVINWRLYAGFHQDHETPSLFVRERLAPGDRVVAAGPPHVISIYHFYVGRVDALVGRWEDFLYYRKVDGRTVGYITGSDVLRDPAELQALAAPAGGGAVWLLADKLLFDPDNDYYSPAVKAWLRDAASRAAYVGLDGQTFATRLN